LGLDHATQSLATISAYAWRHAAVLSFSNLSGDAEQEYFADGMVDDIINGLSRMQQIGSYGGTPVIVLA
jgi:TolB-like protein